ncbi:MAG: hypothetical protein ACJ8G4_14400 [Burkholderiales bacterium]
MACRLALALLAVAAVAACSSTDSMYMRDPYSVSEWRNPRSFSEAFGSPKLPPRYEGSTFSDLYGGSAARAGLLPPMDSKRKIAEQDCSQPVALDQGNLRCK